MPSPSIYYPCTGVTLNPLNLVRHHGCGGSNINETRLRRVQPSVLISIL